MEILSGSRYRCRKCGHTDVRWQGQIFVTDPATGERRRTTVYGKTKSEVASKLRETTKGAEAGISLDAERTTVRAWIEQWFRDVVPMKTKAVTRVSYRRMIDKHILPTIGGLKLAELRPAHVQRLCADRLQAGKSKRTVQYVYSLLDAALKTAVAQGVIGRNPCDAVEKPVPDKKPRQAHSPEDVRHLLAVFAGNKWETLVHLAVYTGMRRAELLGLRWGDVRLGVDGNSDQGYVNVSQVVTELSATTVSITEPKTQKSRRLIALPSEAVALLRRHRVQQNEWRLAMNEEQRLYYHDQDFLFCKPTGDPLQPQRVSESIKWYLRKFGLGHLRPLHDDRHANADLMLQAGIDLKVISDHHGHSTIKITADTYTAVPRQMQMDAAQSLSNLLKGTPAPGGENKTGSRRKLQ